MTTWSLPFQTFPTDLRAFYRLRGNAEWTPRLAAGNGPRGQWRWLYQVARLKRQDMAFAIQRADGSLWGVL